MSYTITKIILWILFLPTMIIDYVHRNEGGIFGGNLGVYFSSAIAQALYMTSLILGLVVFLVSK